MKRLLYIFIMFLLPNFLWAQFTDDPAEPGNKYKLTLSVSPTEAGRVYGGGSYSKGTKVDVYTYANEGYAFSCWKKGDEVVSTSSTFTYIMPNMSTNLTAVYTKIGEGGNNFDPVDPSEPNSPGTNPNEKNTYTLTIVKEPENGGYINKEGTIQMREGETVYLYATLAKGYEMDGWYIDNQLMSIQESYAHTMWNKSDTIVARFMYKPSDPSEPGHSENKEYIVISTQSDLEAYANVEEFPRSVRIIGTGITSLQSLSKMKKINGDLRIENTSLLNLEGLDNLTTITGKLIVSGNRMLVSMDGIYSWDNIYYVLIEDNPELTDFCAMTAYALKSNPIGSIHGNAYNPTFENIADGFCSKNDDVFRVTETSLVREINQIHVKVRFTNEPYKYTSLQDYVSFASETENLSLKSYTQSNLSYDLFFNSPKKSDNYILTINNTLKDTKGRVLNQNGNSYTGEDNDNYTETFDFGEEELYVVAQAPLTGGALSEANYTDLVFNDDVESIPVSLISLVSPSGKAIPITSIEYIDSLIPIRHRVNYEALDEDGNYSFAISTGLVSKGDKSMTYPYQSTIEMPSANFIPQSIEPIEPNWVAGQKQSVKYVVNNVGSKSANGKCVDVIYLSSTDTWNSEAIELYRDTVFVDVNSQGSYTQTVSVDVPTVVDGNYYLILKTNVAHNVPELSYMDNELSAEGVNVSVEVLSDINNKFTLGRGESKIFRVQTESETNVEIIDNGGVANMYLGYYQLPNTEDTPHQGSITILGADASIRYYVLVSNNGKSQEKSQQCELSIRNFELEIGEIGRNSIVKYGTAWIPVEVNGCTDIPVFYLMDSSGMKTECKRVITKSETSFYAQFDTESLLPAEYSLYVECNGMTGIKQNAIIVNNEPVNTKVESKLVLPETSRIGSTITAYIDYYNSGNVDVPAPLFILSGTKGSTYELPTGGTFSSEAHIIGVNENGIISALMPGESNRISVNITIPNDQIATADYKLKAITEGCDGIDEPFYLQWLDVEPNETPSCYTDEEWSIYCNRLRSNVGDTWRTFIQSLGKVVDMFYADGNIDYNANFIYDIIKTIDFNNINENKANKLARTNIPSTLRDVEAGTVFIWKNGQWHQVVQAMYEYYENLPGVPFFVGWAITDNTNLINLSASKNFIISHGWNDDRDGDTRQLAYALEKEEGNCNIFGIDWSLLSTSYLPNFMGLTANFPAQHIPFVADKVINAFCTIYGTNKKTLRLNNLHLIGHSHGAHLCGMIAHKLNYKPQRLTALDASTALAHLYSRFNFGGTGWNRTDAQFIDYYKSSIMCGTNLFKGHNNFILINTKDGFDFSQFNNAITETYRHGYSIYWYAMSILNKDLNIGYNLSSDYLSNQWGKEFTEDQFHGVINGSKNQVENFHIRNEYSISSDEWNYTEPWYGKKLCQGLFKDYIFQNAFATTIEYEVVEEDIKPYQDGLDYIKSGTKENIVVSIGNRADNETVPLNIRANSVQPIIANTIFITSDLGKNKSFTKDKDGYSIINSEADLYILGYNSDYYDILLDGKGKKSNIGFTISSALWDKLAGSQKEEDFIYCDLWLIAACDKGYLLGDWYNSSRSMYYPFENSDKTYRTIKLAKGELYAQNNIAIKRNVKVQNPKCACSAGDDQTYSLNKGQKQTNVTVQGRVTRDNGKKFSYYWENTKSVFSTSQEGNISLGVGKHTLTFRIKAENENNTRANDTSSEMEAEDEVVITIKPYTPGDEDNESTSTASSWDPNEKVGIKGAGGKSCVKSGETMEYSIFFENDAEKAQLAAQTVTVIDTLDVAFDLTTFEFTGSEVANTILDIPTGMIETCVYTDLRPNNDLILKTEMKLDIDSRVVTVVYSSLDSQTNEPTQDVFAGFLPPNDSTHIGEGHFAYRVKLKDDVADGYTVTNQAHIFFDYNDEIATNITSHTIDDSAPSSWVVDMPITTDQDSVLISWTGIDQGAGIKYYDVYYAKNGEPFELWKEKTFETSAFVHGIVGNKYEFFSIATDSLGFVEPMKFEAEAVIEFKEKESLVNGIALNKGWNWISFNMSLDNLHDVNETLSSGKWCSQDEVKNLGGTDSYSEKHKKWIGTLSAKGGFDHIGMFMLNSSQEQTLDLTGKAVDVSETPISIHNGWNYISYLPVVSGSVSSAMVNYQANQGDIIKSQEGFCVYDTESGWTGSLAIMEPSHGYMLYRQNGSTTFKYPNNVSAQSKSIKLENRLTSVPHVYSQNMNIIGNISGDFSIYDGDKLLSVVGSELRGQTRITASSSPTFITIDGDLSEEVSFMIERDGNIIAESSTTLNYIPNAMMGTISTPTNIEFVSLLSNNGVEVYPRLVTDYITISISNSQKYKAISTEIYDMAGQKSISTNDVISGTIYKQSINCKDLTSGIYLVNVMADKKRLTTVKIIKK